MEDPLDCPWAGPSFWDWGLVGRPHRESQPLEAELSGALPTTSKAGPQQRLDAPHAEAVELVFGLAALLRYDYAQ